MRRYPKIGDDILSSKDIDEMIADLEADEEYYLQALEEEDNETLNQLQPEMDELEELRAFREDLEGYCDWRNGVTLIHEDYRKEYAQQLASDIGAISGEEDWPLNHIDWEAATQQLFRYDYTSADIGGEIYYVQNH